MRSTINERKTWTYKSKQYFEFNKPSEATQNCEHLGRAMTYIPASLGLDRMAHPSLPPILTCFSNNWTWMQAWENWVGREGDTFIQGLQRVGSQPAKDLNPNHKARTGTCKEWSGIRLFLDLGIFEILVIYTILKPRSWRINKAHTTIKCRVVWSSITYVRAGVCSLSANFILHGGQQPPVK